MRQRSRVGVQRSGGWRDVQNLLALLVQADLVGVVLPVVEGLNQNEEFQWFFTSSRSNNMFRFKAATTYLTYVAVVEPHSVVEGEHSARGDVARREESLSAAGHSRLSHPDQVHLVRVWLEGRGRYYGEARDVRPVRHVRVLGRRRNGENVALLLRG